MKTNTPKTKGEEVSEESKRYTSNARWTKITKSVDNHDSCEAAKAVCMTLVREYGSKTKGCPIRGHCLEVWVEEVKPKNN